MFENSNLYEVGISSYSSLSGSGPGYASIQTCLLDLSFRIHRFGNTKSSVILQHIRSYEILCHIRQTRVRSDINNRVILENIFIVDPNIQPKKLLAVVRQSLTKQYPTSHHHLCCELYLYLRQTTSRNMYKIYQGNTASANRAGIITLARFY